VNGHLCVFAPNVLIYLSTHLFVDIHNFPFPIKPERTSMQFFLVLMPSPIYMHALQCRFARPSLLCCVQINPPSALASTR
jgi:hypothetical protein